MGSTAPDSALKRHPSIVTSTENEVYSQGAPRGGVQEAPQVDLSDIRTRLRPRTRNLDLPKRVSCEQCKKSFASIKGMRIHQAKVGCMRGGASERPGVEVEALGEQRNGEEPRKAYGEGDQVETHSVSYSTASSECLDTTSRRAKIKWPKSTSRDKWAKMDEELDTKLLIAMKGNAEERLKFMMEAIYEYGVDNFGTSEVKQPDSKPKPNRRQQEIHDIRQTLRGLTKRWKAARKANNIMEMQAIDELRVVQRQRLSTLTKAERLKRKRKKRVKQRQKFFEDPFAFVKVLFTPAKSGELKVSKEELEEHLRETYSDVDREVPLPYMQGLVHPTPPSEVLDCSPPRLSEVVGFVKKGRASSSPGPDGVPYKVLKQCPKLTKILWRLLVVLWRNSVVPEEWNKADGVYIPKELKSEGISAFRPISLLNISGKIMMGIFARRLSRYLLSNGFIDSTIQKAGIPGFPGCIEHSSMIWHTIQKAKERKEDLAVIWLDLANAYGSVPHSLIWYSLEFFHIPGKLVKFLKCYFDNFRMRFTTREYTTSYQKLEVGIPMGCAISPMLFVMAMEVIIRATCVTCTGFEIEPGLRLPPIRAFMDDLTLLVPGREIAERALERLSELIKWCRMKFKPRKSRSLFLKHGRLDDDVAFRIGEENIPTITDAPVKSLGRWFTKELSDKAQVANIHRMIQDGLKSIDRCDLPGKLKIWCLKFGLFPRVLWPLMIYEVAMTHVEKMERMISCHIRKWLGVPPCTTNLCFYGHSTKLLIPLNSLTEEFKVKKAHMFLTLRDSPDEYVKGVVPDVRTGRKWDARKEVDEMESRLRHRDMMGPVQTSRAGLGMNPTTYFFKAGDRQKREMVVKEIRRKEEECRTAKAVGLVQQGIWCTWEDVEQRALSWREISAMETSAFRFLLRATYDVLPSPHNLKKWGKTGNDNCIKCGNKGSLRHVLSNCPVSLTEGLYTWRHNEILKVISKVVEAQTEEINRAKPKRDRRSIAFVKAGSGARGRRTCPTIHGQLHSASDWKVAVDLSEQMTFPPEIMVTELRPDIVLWSCSTRRVILGELTVPWEENVQTAHEYKALKYTELVNSCKERGWKVEYYPIEVGCRGYAPRSLHTFLTVLGLARRNRRKVVEELLTTATRSSAWIWNKYQKRQLVVASNDAAGPPPAT